MFVGSHSLNGDTVEVIEEFNGRHGVGVPSGAIGIITSRRLLGRTLILNVITNTDDLTGDVCFIELIH